MRSVSVAMPILAEASAVGSPPRSAADAPVGLTGGRQSPSLVKSHSPKWSGDCQESGRA